MDSSPNSDDQGSDHSSESLTVTEELSSSNLELLSERDLRPAETDVVPDIKLINNNPDETDEKRSNGQEVIPLV